MEIKLTGAKTDGIPSSIRLFLDDEFVGVIHPGDCVTITGTVTTCVIRAEGGSSECSVKVDRDCDIDLSWDSGSKKLFFT